MLTLELLGTLSLRDETRPVPVAAQQKRPLGLLAILGLARRQGLSRDRIEAYLWRESSGARAQHALDQTVYAIRHPLGSDVILSTGRELRLNPDLVRVDVWEFEQAIRAGQWTEAVGHYKGPLLDGVHFADSHELESWIDTNRSRLRLEYQRALEALATLAADAGDLTQSAIWFGRLANSDPLSAGATKKLMLALAAAGDRAGAVKHARLYQELVRQELEMEPDSEIEDLAAALSRAAVTETAPGKPSVTPPVAASTPSVKERSHRDRRVLYGTIALAVLIAGTAIWGWLRPAPAKEVVRYTMAIDSTEAMAPATPWSGRVAISPDGSRLAYIGGPRLQLWIRARNQLHAIAVPGTEGATTPFFSPDGRHVGFLRERSVQIASLSGGPPITVSNSLTGTSGASWGPDNSIYVDAIESGFGLLRVEATRGSKPSWFTVLDTAKGEVDHTWPDVLPNGKGVLFTVAFRGRTGVKGTILHAVAVAEIPSGKYRVIVDDALYARYASSGHLLYVTTNKTLMVVPFDQNSMRIAGEPTAVSEGMRLALSGGSADLAVSATGTLVYATGAGEGKQELVWVARDGKAQAVDPDWPGSYWGLALSPDGKWVAVARLADAEPINIWIKRLDRGPSIKLTLEGNANYGPAWTPDGRSITFSSDPATGAVDLWTKRADGGTQAVMQLHKKGSLYNPRWSPDGKWLIFQTGAGSPGSRDILGIRPGVDTAPVPVVATKFSEMSPAFSPNGQWLAYVSNETGADEIYVVPFPNTGAGKWAISSGGGTEPLWDHGGNELFYRDASGDLVAVQVNTNPTFSLRRSAALFPAAGFSSLRFTPQYAVALDDRRFLMIRPLQTGTPDKLIVVENWFEELRATSRR